MDSAQTSPPDPQAALNPFSRQQRPKGFRRWLPGLAALFAYERSWLTKDIGAGVVLTAILVPAGMGYAEAAGLPAIYGLYATIVPLLAYALFGPSRILILGPDSALVGLVAATVLPLAAGDPDRAVSLASALAVLSGGLCIAAGLARLGFITDLLSKYRAIEESLSVARDLVGEAREALRAFPPSPAKESILLMADYALQRDK